MTSPTSPTPLPAARRPRSLTVLIIMSEAGKLNYELHSMLSEVRAWYDANGVTYRELFCPGFDQAQARAEIFSQWYHRGETDDAIALDTDMRADPRLVLEMATLQEPLLLAPYKLKRADELDAVSWALDLATDPEKRQSVVREGRRMLPCNGAGFGFVRVRRQAYAQMVEACPSELIWTSHAPGSLGMKVWGLFEPIVHEHPEGSGVMRRRPEDMSFFARARAAGLQPMALLDAVVWNGDKGGESYVQACDRHAVRLTAIDKRIEHELLECPDNLRVGLVEVLDGAYDVPGLEFDNPPTVLDIGANVGAFSVWASKRWPGAKLHAYEPHPGMCAHLRANTALGIFPTPVIHQAAVIGSGSGPVKLFDGKLNDGERSIHPTEGVHETSFTEVPTVSAKELPDCDILKADTEGAEREILLGYGDRIKRCSAVMLEWHSWDDYAFFHEYLTGRGFYCKHDRARGKSLPDRELVFVRRGVTLVHEKG